MNQRILFTFILITALSFGSTCAAQGEAAATAREEAPADIYAERMRLYLQMQDLTHVPWYFLAAVDQYERAIQSVRKDKPKKEGLIAISIPEHLWVGALNPNLQDQHLFSIGFFGGIGLDGDGDNLADPLNDADTLFTMATFLSQYGYTGDDIRIGLWEYYNSEASARHVSEFAAIYKQHEKLDLLQFAFPLPRGYNYSYNNTWGDARGWGGRRMHEGTDIFAGYGTPVRSTCYGYVEVKGWNMYGGWRVGIRDLNNTYHYYAHLSGFAKGLATGQIVEPGTVIGYVGSSGYGKPGTQGKFAAHLHYGMYKHNGRNEWAFDPYPWLKAREREARKQR